MNVGCFNYRAAAKDIHPDGHYTKESLAMEVNSGISSRQVARVLERVIAERGVPGSVRCANGPEFTSLFFIEWCQDHGITVVHIQPGKPVRNGHVESFNGRFRDECLNPNLLFAAHDKRLVFCREG